MGRVPRFRLFTLTGAALLLAGSVVPAPAQEDADDAQRGVARISVMDGDVTVQRGDSGDVVAGVVNAPLMTGDQVATAANARAEIQMDASNALRLGPGTSIRIAQLEYARFQFQLVRGTATYRVLHPTDVNVEVDTDNLAVRPSKEGAYRITVGDDGVSQVTVRQGSVEIAAQSGSQWLNAGQTLLARGAADDPEFKITAAIPTDDWDRWSESRDQTELASASAQYVPPGVYGSEDLDQNGAWTNTPDYGYVWQPYEPVGWSPYSEGQWVWEDWYGWTWMPYEPWGWAPYHYGRWFYRGGIGWAWYPGARFTRHYWSPALVGFVGWGGAGFGLGYVGWVPLAPYEVMHPWWGASYYGRGGRVNRYIGISPVSISSAYRNANVVNAIHGVRGEDFQNGRFTSIGHFSGGQITDARIANGAVPIAPTAANLRFTNRDVTFRPRPAASSSFYSREQPNPARQIPFAQQQSAFQARANAAASAGARTAEPAGARPSTSLPRPTAPAASGWRQTGDRPVQQATPRNEQPAGRNVQSGLGPASRTNDPPPQTSGWQRFGASGTQPEVGAGRPGNSEPRPAQPGGSSWNRFGAAGNAEQTRPQQAPQQNYRPPQNTAPAPQQNYRPPAPAPQPAYRAPAPSAPRPSGGGGAGHAGAASRGGGGHR